VEVGVVLRLDELRGRLGVSTRLEARRSSSRGAPVSGSARAYAPVEHLRDVDELQRQAARWAQPRWCMTHDMSGETMYSAPASMVVLDLVVAHLRRHRLLEDREGAAEAAASSARCGCTNSIPLTRRAGVPAC
jgi:hypothetical protein